MVAPLPLSSPNMQEQFAVAVGLHRAGRLAEAEKAYRLILRRDPDHADSLHLLGVLALQAGYFDDARQWIGAALARNGGSADYHDSLGDISRLQGRMAEAAGSFLRAMLLRPEAAEGWNRLGLALHAAGRQGEAAAVLRRGVALAPDSAPAHNNLGLILGDGGAESFRRALLCAPGLAEAHVNLGLLQAGQGRRAAALVPLRRALALRPQAAESWYALGNLDETGAEDRLAACRATLVCDPGYGRALNLAGLTLVERGDLAGAIRCYRRALACGPDPAIYANLADVIRFAPGDEDLAAMERLADPAVPLTAEGRIALHFALGKAYGDCGDGGKAFGHYQEANRRKRSLLAYDESAELTMMDRVRRAFHGDLFAGLAGRGDPSAAPVFILGMPRSGSTLIEQILASHPKVKGGGERPDFPELLGQIGYPEPVAALPADGYRALGAAYVERVRGAAPDAVRITDKLPGNFLHAGAIHLALPNARIIHSRRDPADTCISCFTTLFRGEHLPHTYDLAELGRYYRAYARLMEHWRAVLPQAVFLEVDYERMIEDPEGQTRRILAHCGLDWDPACLSFHQTRREVRTASAAQVRRPIYAGSVGRWRLYGDLLAPLLTELEIA